VLRASIEQLCYHDHNNDPEVLARWLANKTPTETVRWLSNPDNLLLVAETGNLILAVGCVTVQGNVVLNYVSPNARFTGLSSALLSSMEDAARNNGNRQCSLESTATGYNFYRARGYLDTAPPADKFGFSVFPMTKTL
jgi:GNAT superfamily N-acetyltransferase